MLNEYNDTTKETIHLMVTPYCNRKCPDCCNNQYDVATEVPTVTKSEMESAKRIFLTGGEPFLFTNPCLIAEHLKITYPNIENIFVYTNALELAEWLDKNSVCGIDGVTVSIKTKQDLDAFENSIVSNAEIGNLNSNYLYVFNSLYPTSSGNFTVRERTWQKDFKPHPYSIFRKCLVNQCS